MEKNVYWFAHDFDAGDDPKLMIAMEQIGTIAYAIFFLLVEKLASQTTHKLPLSYIPPFASRYKTSPQIVKTIIENFGLFEIEDDKFFYSNSLNRRMKMLDDQRLKRIEIAQRGGFAKALKDKSVKQLSEKCLSNAEAMPEHTITEQDNTVNYIKKQKIKKEDKEKKGNFAPPSLPDVQNYFDESIEKKGIKISSSVESQKFIDFYSSKNWFVGRNKMTDWKASVRNWINRIEIPVQSANGRPSFFPELQGLNRLTREEVFGPDEK